MDTLINTGNTKWNKWNRNQKYGHWPRRNSQPLAIAVHALATTTTSYCDREYKKKTVGISVNIILLQDLWQFYSITLINIAKDQKIMDITNDPSLIFVITFLPWSKKSLIFIIVGLPYKTYHKSHEVYTL